jgi:hypothetical protein
LPRYFRDPRTNLVGNSGIHPGAGFDWSRLAVKLGNLELRKKLALVGFDGFVDSLGRVVARRHPVGYDPVSTIGEFGRLIVEAAGRSFGREVVIHRIEGGGNAPNLADGLAALGVRVAFWGTVGEPHRAFEGLAARCVRFRPIGRGVGRTLALEFEDGKLMLNDTSELRGLGGAAMQQAIAEGYGADAERADLVGLANWSRYPRMTECWRVIAREVGPRLQRGVWIIVDLADPSGRGDDELREMLGVLGELQHHGRVLLGLNLNEAGRVATAIGAPAVEDDEPTMRRAAGAIREATGLEVVVVHSRRLAAGAWAAGEATLAAWFTASARRTTGVGDRFNAGLAAGLMGGLGVPESLALGCAAGGYFVRAGRAGALGEIAVMCRDWAAGAV